jgi:hypothetical protein
LVSSQYSLSIWVSFSLFRIKTQDNQSQNVSHQTGSKVADLARRNVSGCVFSPLGNFLATYEVPFKDKSAVAAGAAAAAPQPNLLVWELPSLTCKLRLYQKEWMPNNYG